MNTLKSRDKTFLWVILAVHFLLCAVYWHFTPYGIPPDEGPHGLYVRNLVEQHNLLVFDPTDRGNYEAHQPPLYYLLAAPFYVVGEKIGLSEPAMAVRLLSMILGALCILAIYRAARLASGDESSIPLASAGFVALLPMHVMLSSSISNDILSELVFCLGLLLATKLLVNGTSSTLALTIGVITGLGILTKTTCLLLAPVVLAAYLIIAFRSKPINKAALLHLIVAVVIACGVGGWWLLRNNTLYGDPFAAQQFVQAFGHTATPEYWYSHGFSVLEYWILVIVWTYCSFWGVFGHMKVFMPAWFYIALAIPTFAVKVGALRLGAGFIKDSTEVRRDVLVLYTILVVLVAGAFFAFNTRYFQAQARYLFSAILPFGVYWTLGIMKNFPKSQARLTPLIAMSVPAVAQVVALITCILKLQR